MLDYILAGGIFFYGVHLVNKYQKKKQLWKDFENAVKENERLFEKFTDDDYQKLANIFNQSRPEKIDKLEKLSLKNEF